MRNIKNICFIFIFYFNFNFNYFNWKAGKSGKLRIHQPVFNKERFENAQNLKKKKVGSTMSTEVEDLKIVSINVKALLIHNFWASF